MVALSTSSNDVPALPAPPGIESNFTDPPSLLGWVLGVGITTIVLMVVMVGIRIYTKAKLVKQMHREDRKHIAFGKPS
jgi:Ni/Fe-hydrogenase subunit HybB-like protein